MRVRTPEISSAPIDKPASDGPPEAGMDGAGAAGGTRDEQFPQGVADKHAPSMHGQGVEVLALQKARKS